MKRLPVVTFACALIVLCFFGLYLRDFDSVALGDNGLRFTKEHLEIIVTCPLALSAICVIVMKRFGPKDKYWAYVTLGALTGFGLHLQPT